MPPPFKDTILPFTSHWPEGSHMVCLPPLSYLFPRFSILASPSVAKALGVTTVTAQAMKVFQEHPIFSEVVSDQEAVAAVEKFVGMCQVLSRPDLLIRDLSGCPLGVPRDPIHSSVSRPSLEFPINGS